MNIVGCGEESADIDHSLESNVSGYPIVDTGQFVCYADQNELVRCPDDGESFDGQDSQYYGNQPSYTDNGDG